MLPSLVCPATPEYFADLIKLVFVSEILRISDIVLSTALADKLAKINNVTAEVKNLAIAVAQMLKVCIHTLNSL